MYAQYSDSPYKPRQANPLQGANSAGSPRVGVLKFAFRRPPACATSAINPATNWLWPWCESRFFHPIEESPPLRYRQVVPPYGSRVHRHPRSCKQGGQNEKTERNSDFDFMHCRGGLRAARVEILPAGSVYIEPMNGFEKLSRRRASEKEGAGDRRGGPQRRGLRHHRQRAT